MIKASSKFKLALFLFLLSVSVFGVFNFIEDNKVWRAENAKAATPCKGPADVMLVIDRSADMADSSKFSITKSASVNFIDKLFATEPDSSYEDYAYHQVGLAAFNINVESESLNDTGSIIQDIINQSDGMLGDSYPSDYRNETAAAIGIAKNKLVNSVNSCATKTMIVLTDGAPDSNIDAAMEQAYDAKFNKGIRIISVGLKLDKIVDSEEKTKAEDFMRYIASTPSDCYYVSDPENTLENCTSISAVNLEAALDGVYTDITAAVCDEIPPSIEISRTPQGTLYDVDKLVIESTATDDIGFESHSLRWSDSWPDNKRGIVCSDLSGIIIEGNTEIKCSTEEGAEEDIEKLSLLSPGDIINYRSIVTDANDNTANIDEPDPRSVTVANVSLNVPALFRNVYNEISVTISDPNGKADLDSFYVTTKAKNLEGVYLADKKIIKATMVCSGSGDNRNCTYPFNPGCDWTDGIENGSANNITVDIYIYADSENDDNTSIRQIISSENNLLVSGCEGVSCIETGTCSDNINNDCDYKDNDPLKPIIDLNPGGLDEMLCDITGPSIGISRDPVGDIYDFESDGATPMTVTIDSLAGDSNGIKRHTIYYRENGGAWQTALGNGSGVCNDADADGLCDEDASQSILNISATVGPFTPGVIVEYYSVAVDYSGNDKTTSTATKSFIVRNRSCFGIDDLEHCVDVPGTGKCCGGVCNATISNPNNYSTSCAQEVCGDALLYEEDVRVAGIYGNAINFNGSDYIAIPTKDPSVDPNVSASVNPTEAITVAAWVKSATETGYSGYRQIVSKYSAYLLGTSGSGGKQVCFIVHSGGWKYGSCYTVPDPENWHHFVGTYDKSTGEKNLYVDGALQGAPVSFFGSINPDTGPIHIGKREAGGYYFKGLVDEVYVYGRALDLGEIQNLRDGNSVSSADLAGYWSLDEEFGDVAHDNSGSGNFGTLVNFPTPIVKPGILWQWDADEGKNGVASCSNNGDSNGCYSLGGGCEDRGYLCLSGYCNYSSDKKGDYCDYDTGIFYDYGCSAGSCGLISAEVDPICDIISDGNVSIDSYNSDSPSEFIAGTSGSATGDVYDNMTDKVSLIAEASDTNGISKQTIFWKKSVDASFAEINCDISLCEFSSDTCTCTKEIGPFNIGDTIEFYTKVKDKSPNYNEAITITYSFTVFDHQCYDIVLGANENDLTVCGAGKCCGGICDTSIENPSSYHGECRKEACDLKSLVYDWDNNNGDCGDVGTCFPYYTGCVGGNKCASGYCNPDTDGILFDSCAGNVFTDNGCSGGVCGLISGGINCSATGNSDGDSVDCNCDCDNYDIEEKVYSSLSFDGVDDFVEIPNDSSLNISDEISVEVWVKDMIGTGVNDDTNVVNDNDFVSKIRATIGTGESDGDYDKLSTWEVAIQSNLTLASSKVFSVSDRGDYDYSTDDGQAVTFDGGGTGTLKHLNTSNKAYIITVAGTVNAGTVTVNSNAHTFTISDTGQQIGRAIAECYNDWSTGLSDNLSVVGWTSNIDHYVKVYTPLTERHNGTVKADGNYTGFVLMGSGGTKISIREKYTEIDGIILDSTVIYNQGIGIKYSQGNFSKVSNCIFQNFGVSNATYRGLIVGDYMQAYIFNNIFIKSYLDVVNAASSSNYVWVYNNTFYNCHLDGGNDNRTIAKNNIIYYSGACYQGNYEASSSNNISVDATAPGANSLINKTLGEIAFMDTTAGAEDLHIRSASLARNVGVNLKDDISNDIDGNRYLSSWDIGADEYPEGIIISKGIGEEAYSLTVDGDGNVYGNINNQNVSAQITDNNWHQVVLTYNGNNQKVYLDGNEVDNKSLVNTISINTEDLIIGKGSVGLIDEIRIYDRALYPEEVQDHYNGIFADDTGLVGYWNFDEGTGETANDYYDDTPVDNNSGTLKNGPTWMKHYHGSVSGASGNVPENWQVCTDGKDNDCDTFVDNYNDDNGISNCDGEVYNVSVTASAKNRDGVKNENLFSSSLGITTHDVDVERANNNFTISTYGTTDEFLIQQTIIEWTTDNWANKENKVCSGGTCKVCVGSAYSETGVTESGGNKILVDDDKLWTVDEWQNFVVKIVSGTGVGQIRTIVSNTDVQLTVGIDWTTYPDATSEYEINKCENGSTGTATELGSNKTLTNNTKLWIDNEWIGGTIEIISGTGIGQIRNIISNIEDRITVDSDWDTLPNTDSQYRISKKGDVINSSSLSAENTFNFRVCAWDYSVNNNKKCTDYHGIIILSSNLVPEITPLSVQESNFCAGLSYALNWEFVDPDDGQASYKIQVREDNDFENDAGLVIDAEKYVAMDSYLIPNSVSSDFVVGKNIEYGETYYWRVKVTDDRGGGYEKTTEWENGSSFTTPDYKYPQVDFSADSDHSGECLYEVGYSDAENTCEYGEDITFSDDSDFVECTNNGQCLTASAAKCDTADNKCVPCEGNDECAKFNSLVSYSCNTESGICEAYGSCVADDDCRAADAARCDIDLETGIGLCVACDDDLQCTNDKFGTVGIDYFCNNNGKCEDKEHRKWYFYDDLNVDSTNPNPVNNYIDSVVDSYVVTLEIKDILGKSCYKKKNIFLGGKKYPKWNEMPPSGN